MAEITAALVKALRDKTDAGMMDCKKALNECNGDMDAAVKYLREKGIAKAAAKADRDAKEGVIRAAVAPCGCSGIILELNCETDFCAKGDKFQGLVNDVANALMDSKASTLEEALQVPMAEGSTEEYIKAMCSSIGENMALRKFARLTADGIGAVVSYIHMGGKVGVLLSIKAGIQVSLFIDPEVPQVEAAARLGAPMIELHTGCFANHSGRERTEELARLKRAAELAHSLGIQVNAGHGINYQNLEQLLAGVPYLHELNIGHTIVSRALFVGMEQAVREMRQAIDRLS